MTTRTVRIEEGEKIVGIVLESVEVPNGESPTPDPDPDPDPVPPEAVVIDLDAKDSLTMKIREWLPRQSGKHIPLMIVKLKDRKDETEGVYGRMTLDPYSGTSIGEIRFIGEGPDTVVNCNARGQGWIAVKGGFASRGKFLNKMVIQDMTVVGDAMDGPNDRLIFAQDFDLEIKNVWMEGAQETGISVNAEHDCLIDGLICTKPASNKVKAPVGHCIYSIPADDPEKASTKTLTIRNSFLWVRNKHCLKNNHATCIVEDTEMMGGDLNTGAEIGSDVVAYRRLRNVKITQPESRGSRSIVIYGTGTSGRPDKFKGLIKPIAVWDNVELVDFDTEKTQPPPPRIRRIGEYAETLVFVEGSIPSTYNGEVIDLSTL